MSRRVAPCPCGAEREAGTGRGTRYCAECREKRRKAKLCNRCGERPKRPGAGQRLCEACEPVCAPRPCSNCGRTDVAKTAHGSRFCVVCAPVVAEAAKARKRARARMKAHEGKLCACGASVGYRRRTRCDRCAAKAERRVLCSACGERPIRAKHKKYCVVCAQIAERARRRYVRTRRRRLAEDPCWRERERAYQRAYARGRAQRQRRMDRKEPLVSRLPLAPLVQAFSEAAARLRAEQGGLLDGERAMTGLPSPETVLMERAGSDSRTWRAWRNGEWAKVGVGLAGRVLLAIDREWWEVWSEDRWPAEHMVAAQAFGEVALAR